MINVSQTIADALVAPVRKIRAKVELYEGSTLVETCYCTDRLINFSVERIGDMSKFFGFGICQRLNVHLIDLERTLNITTDYSIKVSYTVDGYNYTYPYPTFHVTETNRDENTNELSITAYDLLHNISKYTVADLKLEAPYSPLYLTATASNLIGTTGVSVVNIMNDSVLSLEFAEGGNFEGTELLRDVLDDVGEFWQSIYYVDSGDRLTFKRMDRDGDAKLTIYKRDYITLSSKTNRRLSAICSATELGDNVIAETGVSGTTQYCRDNSFYTMRTDDIGELLDEAIEYMGNFTINQFDCLWRGNYTLELGDKIFLHTKDNKLVHSYILNDIVSYNGALMETTSWQYTNSDEETAANPTKLGDALKQTFAKVDKVNKQIDLVVSEVGTYTESIANIQVKTDSITNTVQGMEETVDGLTLDVDTLTNRVSSTMTEDEIRFLIEEEYQESGVAESVVTKTGFLFNDEGLTIEKSGSNVTTRMSENGLEILRSGEVALSVNDNGVTAQDLHATTYLLIGENSRFEDYQTNRTGCFWIGTAEEDE